jgi:hypothetical protein
LVGWPVRHYATAEKCCIWGPVKSQKSKRI